MSTSTLAPELENKGSVARDHLASERTFLAWLRTSLSCVSLGVAIAQLFKIPELIDNDDDDQDSGKSSIYFLSEYLFDSSSALDPSLPNSRKLQSIEKLGKPIGGAFIALGIVVLILGTFRFYKVQNVLMKGFFPPSRVEISLVALISIALIIAAISVILGTHLT